MKKRKKFFSFSFYFWVAFVVLMVILFFINRAVIKKTITKIKDSPSFSNTEIINDSVKEVVENSSQNESVGINIDKEKLNTASDEAFSNEHLDDIEEISKIKDLDIKAKQETEPKESEEKVTSTLPKKDMRNIEIYFASVNDNGVVTREKCIRSIEHSLSPMVDSLNALLQGPTKEEAKQGIRSFIPADTRLLSASIKDETAIINLSDDFQFNRYGVEGYNIQLQQIVFTVCSFPTVKSVQFLIEGQERDFLGSEGVWIGSPFNISSF